MKGTPPLVVPEGASSSLDSPDTSEHNGTQDSHIDHGPDSSKLLEEIVTDPSFPDPPSEGFCSENDAQHEPIADDFSRAAGNQNEQVDNSHKEEFEEQLPTVEEQSRDYCFVEHSETEQRNIDASTDEIAEEMTHNKEPIGTTSENGQNSEESCGSFLLIKPDTEVESGPTEEKTYIIRDAETMNKPTETLNAEKLQLSPTTEANELNSTDQSTQPVQSHSPSQFSYHSEEPVEHGLPETFDGDDISKQRSMDSNSHPLYQLESETVLQDPSLSTTVGVSELRSYPEEQETVNHTLPEYADLTVSNDADQSYRYSLEGGSSYHDDVPIEEVDEFQYREEVGTRNDIKEGHVPRVHEQSAAHTKSDGNNFTEVTVPGIVDQVVRPSFQEICADLDRKNVVSHLQQCTSGQFVMPQVGNLRQEDIVVLNPQTGEVLGSGTQPAQKITLMSTDQPSKVGIVQASTGDNVNGTTNQQPVNSADNSAGRGTQPYTYRIQQDGGGGSSPRGGGTGGSGGSGANNGPTVGNGMKERARQVYNMAECQLAQLTVFMDRALVCRRIRPRFNASEITEVLFEHLSPAIDKDSVRVEIRGAATILDVTYTARCLATEEDTWTHAINELTAELRQCHRQAESLTSRLARASKQRMVLDTFADNLIRKDEENNAGPNATPPNPTANHVGGGVPAPVAHGAPSPILGGDHKGSLEVINPYDPRNMDTLHRFLGMYEEQTERLDATLLDANEELDHVNARIEAIEKEIHEIELKQDERLARELSVLVEPRETGQVEMLISYVVSKCSWRPAYDIRIFNSDGTMKIVYYGMVQQTTGENWETRSMTLSTTLPGTGGTVPHLGLQRVHFKKDHSPATPTKQPATNPVTQLPPPAAGYVTMASRNRSTSKMTGFRRSARPTTTSFHEADRVLSDYEREASTPIGTLQRGHSTEIGPSSTVTRQTVTRMHSRRALGTSMLFHAPSTHLPSSQPRGPGSTNDCASTASAPVNTANIPTVHLDVPRPPGLIRCDNQPVRVTVGLLDLQPRYEYVTVPKRSLHAYLKATAVNKSDFSILAGETNIYADNTFIGKSEIPAVAQGEEFSCNLGAEQGIKVFYRPLFKYREGSGSNSKHATLTFKQLIEVRNTFDRSIRLMVMDQVPLSCEDKIKINLLEPVIKHPEKYDKNKPIRMNKSNNVEWDLDLGPGETKELTLKYSIEHPVNEDLDVSVSEA